MVFSTLYSWRFAGVAVDWQSWGMADLDESQVLARVQRGLVSRWPDASVGALKPLPGGVSSLTFSAALTGTAGEVDAIVIKVAPPGLEPIRNRDVLRQSRIMKALAATEGVPVPEIYCEDNELPPLFAMSYLPGDSYEPKYEHSENPPSPENVRQRAITAAQVLARMQKTSLAELGIGDEPVLSVQDELDRWERLLSTVDPSIAPGHEALHQRLNARVPTDAEPTLLHGDFRLANMLFVGPELTSVIDWEIWSVGDPRNDLAWVLMHTDPQHRFLQEGKRTPADLLASEGMPTLREMLDAYLEINDLDLTDLTWFIALSYYKVASTISVFVKRQLKAENPDPKIMVAATTLPAVIARANEVMDAFDAGLTWRY